MGSMLQKAGLHDKTASVVSVVFSTVKPAEKRLLQDYFHVFLVLLFILFRTVRTDCVQVHIYVVLFASEQDLILLKLYLSHYVLILTIVGCTIQLHITP